MPRVKFTWGPGNSAAKCNDKAAHSRDARYAVNRAAEELAIKAESKMAEHHRTGAAQITLSHGSLDWFVNLEDAGHGKGEPAAAAIEFGHTTKNGKFVNGVHALTGSL